MADSSLGGGDEGKGAPSDRLAGELDPARSTQGGASQLPVAVVKAVPDEKEATLFTGSRLTFAEFYLAQYPSLVRLAFVLTSSSEVAEDLVQDCFVRVHRHYENLDTPDRYVKQAVVNACKSHFRRLGRERDRRPLLYVVDGDSAAGGTTAGELHDVLMELPYRQRAAVVLRYFADLSEAEIAEVLDCRPGTVGSLIHRGLERLRGAIAR
jgi:DNA-directed RNA polymerase specialized sigma24 family protein